MSAIRLQKIDSLVEYAKTILPQIEAEITKELQAEIDTDPILREFDKKPKIDLNKLKERTKQRLVSELKKYALTEFAPNRKTLSEYLEIVLLKLGYE